MPKTWETSPCAHDIDFIFQSKTALKLSNHFKEAILQRLEANLSTEHTTSDGLASLKGQKRLLIGDRNLLLAEGLQRFLSVEPHDYIVEIVTSPTQLEQLLKSDPVFDLALLDHGMLDPNCLNRLSNKIQSDPSCKVALFSDAPNPTITQLAIDSGTRGVVPKSVSLDTLAIILNLIISGQLFLPVQEASGATEHVVLRDNELKVLRLTANGFSNKEISTASGITEVSVKMHMRSICKKLDARNRVHAVVKAKDTGLL